MGEGERLMTNNADKIVYDVSEKIKAFDGKPLIIAIDGRCASGKTTLAAAIKEKIGCGVIHADDFFLRVEQRTHRRLEEAGGNIDYERLRDEALIPLRREGKCSYRRFDCKSMKISDETTVIEAGPLTVVEGSYSCHPMLWKYYDYRIFMNTSREKQLERIELRNGAEALSVFQNRWIPLEEKYFSEYRISERCDTVIDT